MISRIEKKKKLIKGAREDDQGRCERRIGVWEKEGWFVGEEEKLSECDRKRKGSIKEYVRESVGRIGRRVREGSWGVQERERKKEGTITDHARETCVHIYYIVLSILSFFFIS